MPRLVLRVALIAIVALGVGLHIYIALFESASGFDSFNRGLVAWSCLPYVAAFGLALLAKNALVGVVAASLALLVDVWTCYGVFVHPTGSTAALALLWMPLWNLILVVPIGAGAAWLWLRTPTGDQRAP